MQRAAPSLLWITLHDIDIAHSGAFSLYLDGIRRSDRLCAEIWRTAAGPRSIRSRTRDGTISGRAATHTAQAGAPR